MALNLKKLAQFCNGEMDRMFLLGMPGTGKSYSLFTELLPAWRRKNPQGKVAVLAFTNKAVKVVEAYASEFGFHQSDTLKITTVHKFCKLIPTINDSATDHKDLQLTRKTAESKEADLVIVDEVGMVDSVLANYLEDEQIAGRVKQFAFLGDYNQLKPVNGNPAILPDKSDWVTVLSEIRRSECPDIQQAIVQLSAKIDKGGAASRYRVSSSENIVHGLPEQAEMIVAWRNATVQQHNAERQGYSMPRKGDVVYSDTLKQEYQVCDVIPLHDIHEYRWLGRKMNGGKPVFLDEETDAFNTLKRTQRVLAGLMTGAVIGLELRPLDDADAETFYVLTVFGTGDYRTTSKDLASKAIEANQEVMDAYGLTLAPLKSKRRRGEDQPVIGKDGTRWETLGKFCQINRKDWRERTPDDPIEVRANAWSAHFLMNEWLFHADFNHARTVHAMQGSSVDTVFVDLQDISRSDTETFHRLLYVGLSRARNKVFYN